MRVVAAALALAAALSACTIQSRTGYFGDDVAGTDVARTIDVQIAPALRTALSVDVAHAACPDRLDVSLGKIGYCTLRVGDATVRIAVTGGHASGTFFVKQANALLDMRDVERRERALLWDEYHLDVNVRCGSPRVRVAVAGMKQTCAVLGRNVPAHHVDFKVVDSAGHIFMFGPPGVRSPISPLMPYLHAHQARRPAIIPGPLLASYIEKMMHGRTFAPPAGGSIAVGAATCPAKVDLSGTRRGRCRQRVTNGELRVAVWIDEPAGLHVQTLDFAVSTKRVVAIAAEFYRNKVDATGYSGTVAVDCGPDRVVITTPARGIPCTLTYGGVTKPMVAHPDDNGGLRIDVP